MDIGVAVGDIVGAGCAFAASEPALALNAPMLAAKIPAPIRATNQRFMVVFLHPLSTHRTHPLTGNRELGGGYKEGEPKP